MEFVFNIIKGVMIGIANVIPGVSGGTMAVSFGIYDRLISSISGFTKHVKESLALLAPILLGCGLGIAGFTYAIEYLLENHTFVTCMTFVGLILGGLPALYRAMNEKKAAGSGKMGAGAIIAFLLAFAAGAMIYVVVEELIPESQTNENKDWMALFTLVGFSVMMVMDVALG